MQQLLLRIVGGVILVIVILLGIYEVISLNRTINKLQHDNVELVEKVDTVNRIKEANEKLFKEEIIKAREATKESVKIQDETNEKYIATRNERDKAIGDYTNLINNGYRLRDKFTTDNSNGVSNNTVGNDKESDSTVTIGSDTRTSVPELSSGLTEYLGRRTIQADAVVDQLKQVQDYAKMQHQWILNNCNSIEYKENK